MGFFNVWLISSTLKLTDHFGYFKSWTEWSYHNSTYLKASHCTTDSIKPRRPVVDRMFNLSILRYTVRNRTFINQQIGNVRERMRYVSICIDNDSHPMRLGFSVADWWNIDWSNMAAYRMIMEKIRWLYKSRNWW